MRISAKTVLDRITEKIKREYQPEKIILFGSHAYGKPTRDSDIDLFIIKETKKRHIDRSVEVAEILDEENREVALDLLVYTPGEIADRLAMGDDFIKIILNEGKILYESTLKRYQ